MTKIPSSRLKDEMLMRGNPLRNLNADALIRAIENFDKGWFTDAVRMFRAIKKRDDLIANVASKRIRAVSRLGWNIIAQGGDEGASQRHAEVLEDFYNNLEVLSALDGNVRGDISLLAEQILTALENQYSVHEIIWKPSLNGISATLKFAPLWFFENTEGVLRFKPTAFSATGEPLKEGEWLVAANDIPLMEAASCAYVIKRLALGDWSIFSERFGSAFPKFTCAANRGSEEWESAENAVANLANDAGIVISKDDAFELIQASAQGLPMPGLVERMDRAIAQIFRGSDLSTLSSKDGSGASLQNEEKDILLESDCALVERTLAVLSGYVIAYTFGANVKPAAYFKYALPKRSDKKMFLETVKLAAELGCPISKKDVYEAAELTAPNAGEEVVSVSAAAAQPSFENAEPDNDAELIALAKARGKDIAELVGRIETALRTSTDYGEFMSALELVRNDLPKYLGAKNEAAALEKFMKRAAYLGFEKKKAE